MWSTVSNLESDSVHAGREDLRDLGVHVPPIDLSTTYPIHDLSLATQSLDALAEGDADTANPIYARLSNPTVRRFETALAELEGAADAVAFSSGMAVLTACLLAARADGGHVVAVRPLYGGTDHLLTSGLLPLDVTFAEAEGIAAACRPDTSLVILETPANPTLALVDIEDVVRQAGSVPVLVDSTFATPILQRPLEHGARLVVHSATKFLGGHGDLMGGVVATDEEWAHRLRKVRILTGAVLYPLAGYLLHRGLQTLPVRVERAQRSAQLLARRLADHPAVKGVLYPGLAAGDPQRLVGRQMKGPGSMIAFEVEGGYDVAARIVTEVRMLTPAVSLGSVDSLIEHPAGLTHRTVDPEIRRQLGITDGLLRISVGLEAPEDLWSDLNGAIERARNRPNEAPPRHLRSA